MKENKPPDWIASRNEALLGRIRGGRRVWSPLLVILCAGTMATLAGAAEPAEPVAAKAILPSAPAAADASPGKTVKVASATELQKAVENVEAGTTILIAPGSYSRGIFLKSARGTPESPIVIAAADPARRPVFSGWGEGAKLSHCAYVKLSGLEFTGFDNNGVNIDDGGDADRPSHHVILEKLTIVDTGPRGNHDALKMSGVRQFVVRDCRFEGWGGSAIDLVGCHFGVIERCQFLGREGDRTKNAVQIKGGSASILVQTSYFRDAGERIVSIGGATDLKYFRPVNANYEAKNVTVAGNRFVRGEAHVAWVTSTSSHVHHNVFYLPGKWVGRIMQETQDPRFPPCQGGLVENHLIVTDGRVRVHFNVGAGTDASTFTFRGNAWYRSAGQSKPTLPTREIDGVYDVDPQLIDAGEATMRIGSPDPRLEPIGPGAYKVPPAAGDFTNVSVPLVVPVLPPAGSSDILRNLGTYAAIATALVVVAIIMRQLRGRGQNQRAA